MEPVDQVTADVTRTWDRPAVIVPSLAVVAAVGGLFGSFTLPANLWVLGVGGALIWLGVSGHAGRRVAPVRLDAGARWWLVPVLALTLVEVFAFTMKSEVDYPTLSLLADPLLEGYVPRAVGYFLWLVGFWGLVRR